MPKQGLWSTWIDFEKAFDTLDWVYIDKSLNFFNIPDTIHKWVKILYNDISSCVINNGWASNYFKLKIGVRQVCPPSPYLFIIAAEILALKVRQNNDIQGIQIGNKTVKIKQYADDTQVFSLFEPQSIQRNFQGVWRIFNYIRISDKLHKNGSITYSGI